MNTILQSRIEKAAREFNQKEGIAYALVGHTFNAFIAGANYALQNQWISVDEALPKSNENVFVVNEFGGNGYAHYDYENKTWRMSSGGNAEGSDEIHSTITHWMEIPKNI